jgi:hypothetical protein
VRSCDAQSAEWRNFLVLIVVLLVADVILAPAGVLAFLLWK